MTPTKVIGDYTAANSIDGTTHYLLIQPGSSSTAYQKINRNVFLGVTGQPMDINSVQTISNKIIDNTNLVTLLDGSFTLQNNVDTTKRAIFSVAGVTTGTTRTYLLPNASSTLVDLISAQTLTNKTLTSPTITGGSIDNTTITVDTISGHTTANTGTVYGLAVTAGKISGTSITTGTIGTTQLATNAVQGNQLATNAITLGYTQITGNITTASASFVQATGLTVTVTIPSGGRKVEITVFTSNFSSASGTAELSIWDGGVAVGTQLSQSTAPPTQGFQICMAVVTPSAGSKTYNVGFLSTAAVTATLAASSTAPAFILVKAI